MLNLTAPARADGTPVTSPRQTPVFGLPLPCHAECGGCQRFVPINPFTQVSGRCKIGILPGIINRRVKGCLMHRPRGVPARFQGKPVRP